MTSRPDASRIMEMADLPIIVLAFANEQEGRRYLRDLPEELRRLSGHPQGGQA